MGTFWRQRDKLRKFAEYQDMMVVFGFSDEGFFGKILRAGLTLRA